MFVIDIILLPLPDYNVVDIVLPMERAELGWFVRNLVTVLVDGVLIGQLNNDIVGFDIC